MNSDSAISVLARTVSDYCIEFSLEPSGPNEGSPVKLESLILAQNERWRRASYMQVVRERGATP